MEQTTRGVGRSVSVSEAVMIKIVSHGVNPTKEQIEKLVVSAVEIVLPKEYRGTDHVTDYWVKRICFACYIELDCARQELRDERVREGQP